VPREKYGPVPAALPLLAFAAGLACAPQALNAARDAPLLGIAALLLLGLRRTREAMIVLALAGGLALATHAAVDRAREQAALTRLPADRFALIEAPLDRDWAPRPGAFVLRLGRFRANGVEVKEPLVLASHSEPPPIGMAASVRAEAFLRINDRGQFVASVKSPRLVAYAGRLAWWKPASWNRALINRLRPYAAERGTEVALVEAIALGRSERLDDTVRESYRQGGTYHLLVFSGLQIALAAGAIALLLRWLHAPRLSDWSLLSFALLMPFFIGPTPAVSRAAVGIGLYAFARILHRPTSLQNLWCVAALVRLAFAPDDLAEAAFQLTYAGAGALLFIRQPFPRFRRLGYAVVAELAITPLALFHFHQYALGGSILTLLLLPLLMTMLVVAVLTCAIPCTPLLAVMGALHHVCEALNAVAGDTLRLSGFFAAPPHWSLALAAVVSLLAMAWLKRARPAVIVVALLLPTGAAIARHLANRAVALPRLTMLDVGQGDSILVRDGPRVLLVDGGGRNDAPRFGETTLLPLLADRGVRRVDVLVLTHVHPDHCGGLPAVVDHLDVGEVWLSPRRFRGECAQRLLEAITRRAVPIRLLRPHEAPRPVLLGGLNVVALTAGRTFKHGTENNASVVLRVAAGGRVMLLTGDIEREAEALLAGSHDLRADILKVAHHGSHTSTSEPLLDAVRPRLGLISCGRNNLFGHPHASVLAALAAHGVRTWRTDLRGSIDVEIDRGRVFVQAEFDTPRRAVLQ
jgi:competence protein ComEC